MIKVEIMLRELLMDHTANEDIGQILGSVVHQGANLEIIPSSVMFVALNQILK